MEEVSSEPESAIRHRRLSAACRILQFCGSSAVPLVQDLGFSTHLRHMLNCNNQTISEQEESIIAEILKLLSC